MHEQRGSAALQHVQQRCHPLDRLRPGQRLAGQRGTHEPAVERRLDGSRAGVRAGQRSCRPARQPAVRPLDQVAQALVVGADQLQRLGLGQRLDAERRRERDHGPIDAGLIECRQPAVLPVPGEVDGARRLVRHVQHRGVAVGFQVRRGAAGAQLVHQRARPEVLVDVGSHLRGETINM